MTDQPTEFSFKNLLARADEEVLQELLGRPAVRLLTLLDPTLAFPSQLRDLVSRSHSPADLLRNDRHRNLLIDVMPLQAALALQQHLRLDDSGDVYATLKSMSFGRGSVDELRVFEFLGVAEEALPPSEPSAPAVDEVHADYGLFVYQRAAVRGLKSYLASDRPRVLLHMPTGSGKTRTTMHLIADHLRHREPTLVTWLAYSEELCEQAAAEFTKAWQAQGNRPVGLFRFWGSRDINLADANDGFLVAGLGKTYQAARRSISFIASLADRTSLVIIDEAHQAIAETYQLVLEAMYLKKPGTGLVGLTATPGRTWANIDADEQLARFFARQKVAVEIEGYSNPVDYLIREGYLAQPEFRPLNYSGGFELSDQDLQSLSKSLEIPPSILERLAEDEQRNLQILNEVEKLGTVHQRILVFAATVEHAQLLATVLEARGLEAHCITGKTPSIRRAAIIDRFRSESADAQALCNFGVLTTGFDAPRTSAAVIARPTKSMVLYFQMVGRAIRGPKAGGNANAEIVTVVDTTLPGFGDVGDAFLNWEDVWE